MKRAGTILLCLAGLLLGAGCARAVNDTGVNIHNIQFSGDEEENRQSCFAYGYNEIAKVDSGYYYVQSRRLNYYDKELKQSVPVCARGSCDHAGQDCMAYTRTPNIYAYQGYLYQAEIDDMRGEAILVRFDGDGNNRKELGILCVGTNTYPNLTFCNGYVYYTQGDEKPLSTKEQTEILMRMSLDGGEPETVFEYRGINSAIIDPKAYGANVYFLITRYEPSGDTGQLKGEGLFSLDTASMNCTHIMEGDIYSYAIDMKNHEVYYYVIGDGLYKYNADSGAVRKLYEATEQSGRCTVSFDGENVYMTNIDWKMYSRSYLKLDTEVITKIWVFDKQDALMHEMDIEKLKCNFVCFGDRDYLFVDARRGIYMLDKQDIKKNTFEKLGGEED